jgi:ABC-type microcin C transport system permease subunit YejE
MPVLKTSTFLIMLNDKPVVAASSTHYYVSMIMSLMREEHFEGIFGIPISTNTEKMEEQYEEEYKWEMIEV